MLRSLLYTICCLCIAHNGFAQASFFDPTFGTGGKTILSKDSEFTAIAIQPDGKIVVASNTENGSAIARFKLDGTLDSVFAINGFYYGPNTWDVTLNDITIQPDGKIVAIGRFAVSEIEYYTIRLNADGTPDMSFGGTSYVTVDFGPFSNDWGYVGALQPDGKIVLAGYAQPANIGAVRLKSNGIVDSSFGTNGLEKSTYGNARSIAMAPDGKIVIAGYATASHGYAVMALRYMPDGALDTSFNHTGIVYNNSASWGNAVLVQADGKILLLGSGSGNFFVVRYNVNGSIDNSFGTDGIASIDFYGRDDLGYDFCFTPDGKILITGASRGSGDTAQVAIACLNSNGTLNHSFGNFGRIINPMLGISDYGIAIAQQSDGRVIVAGHSLRDKITTSYRRAFISRYLPYPSGILNHYKHIHNSILYPNPTNEKLYIDSKEKVISVQIINATGEQNHNALLERNSRAVNIQQLNSGIYFFKIFFEDGSVAIEKVVVQR